MSARLTIAAGTAALAGAVVLVSIAVRPPPRLLLNPTPPDGMSLVRGAFHLHTVRSDGTGTLDEIATAARTAGLAFVVITDHGDGTRAPEPPAYRGGVLCIDAVELSTSQGHYVAIGLPPAPYPLRGHPADVVEDVRRSGALGIVTHPVSPKPELAWRDWEIPVDGLEWVNADSEWRDDSRWTLAATLLRYPWRPAESLAGLIDDTARALARWDELSTARRVVALAGVDAHGGLAVERDDESTGEYTAKPLLRVPSYETSLRLLDNVVLLANPLTGEARHDAAEVIEAMRRGRVSSAISGVAGPGWITASATSGGQRAWMGESIWPTGPLLIEVASNAPSDSQILLKRNGTIVQSAVGRALRYVASPERGALRAEVWLRQGRSRMSAPWGVTNPIYVSYPPDNTLEPVASWTTPEDRLDAGVVSGAPAAVTDQTRWHAEADPTSRVEWAREGASDSREVRMRVTLGSGGRPGAPYGALTAPIGRGTLAITDAFRFSAAADRPCRLSIQIRAADGTKDRRWRLSVYLDRTRRTFRVPIARLRAVSAGESAPRPEDLAEVDSMLLVLDTVNLAPGQQRTVRVAVAGIVTGDALGRGPR